MSIVSFVSKISIEPVVLLYMLAIFAEYSVMEDLMFVNRCAYHLNLTNNTDDLHHCTEDLKHGNSTIAKLITSETNSVQLIYNCILYATSIMCSFVVAAYADRRSKFMPLLLPLLGSASVQALVIISLLIRTESGLPFAASHAGIGVVYVCSLISGITGGSGILLPTSFAHVAEKCHPSHRTSRITIVEACLFAGGFFGFSVSGAILRNHPNSWNRYFFNFGLFLLIHLTLSVYIVLRRSLFTKPVVENSDAKPSVLKLLASVFNTVFKRRPKEYQRFLVLLIIGTYILISLWNALLTTSLYIYARNQLHWPSWKYFYYNSGKFAICGIFLCLLPVVQYTLTNRYHRSPLDDYHIITIGLLSRGLSVILIGLTSLASSLVWPSLVSFLFAEYPIPALRGLISKIVEPNEKTRIFVVLASLQTLCFFFGGMGFPLLYNYFLDHQSEGQFQGPSLLFVLVGGIQFLALAIFA